MSSPSSSPFEFVKRGASILTFKIGDQNIVQSFPTEALFSSVPHPHFGETIGRTTNRVKDAVLPNLNGGKTYKLAANNGPNSLHGGAVGWGKKDWDGPHAFKDEKSGRDGVLFKYLSKDGEEGYPGTLEARTKYVGYTETKEGREETVLEIEYECEFVGDECEETVIGMTNHSYFNLNLPAPTIEGHVITLSTPIHQQITPAGIPTGKLIPHPEVPSEPNTPFTLGTDKPDPDDCFVLNQDPSSIPIDTRPLPLQKLITLAHPASKLHLEVYSTEPAFQFYTGRFVDVPEVDDGKGEKVPKRGRRAGMCVEPSRWVDCAGNEEWRSMCLLKKGGVFGAKCVYRGWKE
ncbi:hypothetical protein MMC25_002306 [Agyrium rufum]|nr:hypothetical protein [Agyrium rufum]